MTGASELTVMVQVVLVPTQAPDQPVKTPLAPFAVSATEVPGATEVEQVPGHLMTLVESWTWPSP